MPAVTITWEPSGMVEEIANIHLSSIMIFANGKKVFKPLTSGAVVDQDARTASCV